MSGRIDFTSQDYLRNPAPAIERLRAAASPSRVILALNVNTPTALLAYTATVHDLAPPFRIWVTETGVEIFTRSPKGYDKPPYV